MQPYIKEFQDHTSHSIKMSIDNNAAIARAVESFDIDIAVVESWEDRPGFTVKLWRQEELVLIVPPDHHWANLQSIESDQLSNQLLIGGESGSGTGRVLRQYLGTQADTLGISFQLGSTAAVKRAVQAGLGISIVMKASVEDESRLGLFSTIPFAGEPLKKNLYIVYREALGRHPSVAAFINILNSH